MTLAESGSRSMAYRQILDAMFPMAASFDAQVDVEMVAFSGETHIDNLEEYYSLVRGMLLDPGWREEDFQRVKDDAINAIRTGLRGNDEELAKEVLITTLFAGSPYGHYSGGTVSSLEKLTLDDVKSFYHAHYSQSNLILGIAGGYTPAFLESVKKDFRTLPEGAGFKPRPMQPPPPTANRAVIIDKDTRSVAFSLGFRTLVTRSSPDYPALLLAASYLGQHRMSGGVLYERMREQRGLNYGDYAYIEYFPRGMYLMEPEPNLARNSQVFQLWIRPVEPPTAVFALRLALFELDRLVRDGIPEDAFERTREFLTKYVNVLTATKSAELGYAIDSLYYGIPRYGEYIRTSLAKLKREDVNRVIRQYLRSDRLLIVAVTKDAGGLKRQLTSGEPSPMTYNSPKPQALLEEDRLVEKRPLAVKPENIVVIPAAKVFE
jgi:zinc protease